MYPPWFMLSVLAIFWMAGVALASRMWRVPVVRVEVTSANKVRVDLKYPLSTTRHQFAFAELSPAVVVESQDSEGDPYFECKLQAVGGFSTTIAESSSKEYCERCCKRFNEAIAKNVSL